MLIVEEPDADVWLFQRNKLTALKASLTTEGLGNRFFLLSYVFESMRKVRQYSHATNNLPHFWANRCEHHGSQFYMQCYDCCKDRRTGLLCESCFRRGRHEGHRYVRLTHGQLKCNCGDESSIDPQGFCHEHQQQLTAPDSSSIDRQVKRRLAMGMATIFEQLFHLCEINNTEFDCLLSRKYDCMDEKALGSLAISRYVENIVDLLCFFGRDFCQNNQALSITLIEIISAKRAFTRNHVCNKPSLQQTFQAKKQASHICQKSILELLFMHSSFISCRSEALNQFLRSLIRVSRPFHKLFIETYLSKYQFLINPYALDRFDATTSLHCLYEQFTQKEHIKLFLNSHDFENVFEQLLHLSERFIPQQDQLLSQQTMLYSKAIVPVLQLLRHLAEHVCAYKLEVGCFKMVNQLIRVSFASKSLTSKSVDMHKLKLDFDHQLLLLIRNLLRSLQFRESHSKKLLQGLLFMYLNEKQTQLEEGEDSGLPWSSNLPERILALVLLRYFLNYSLREAKDIFRKVFDDRTCQAVVKQLLNSYAEQERMLGSHVHSLGDNFQQLIRGVVRNPHNLMFDCQQLCLQLFLLLSQQELFVKYIFEVIPEPLRARFILDLILEESYFVNVCNACGWGETVNAKKLYFINAFNMHNATFMTLPSIMELYDQTIFNAKTLQPEEALWDIARYDSDQQALAIKPELQGFTYVQPWLFARNRDLFLTEVQPKSPLSVDEFQRCSLLRKQIQLKLDTFCGAVSRSIAESILFISNIVVKLSWQLRNLDEATILKQKEQVRTKLKLLQVLLIRNVSNKEFVKFVQLQHFVGSKEQHSTSAQIILQHLFSQFQNDCEQSAIRESEECAQQAVITKSKVVDYSQSVELFQVEEQFEGDAIMEDPVSLELAAKCLNCTQDRPEQLVCGLRILTVTTAEAPSLCFDSCQHAYHRSCLTASNQREFVCPKCFVPYTLLLPWVHTYYTFYKKNTIALRILMQKSTRQKDQELQALSLSMNWLAMKNDKLRTPIRPQLIEQMITSRLHLSLALSPKQFLAKLFYSLRTLFCVYLWTNQYYKRQPYFTRESLNEAIIINDQQLLTQIAGRRAHTYRQLLVLILRMAATFDSIKFNQLLKRAINKYFNAYLALKISGECSGSLVTVEQLSKRLNSQKQRYQQHMIEFSRGVLYMYSLAYEDACLEDLNLPTDVISRNQQFFSLDLQMITTLVYLLNKQQQPAAEQPIVNIQKLIELPNCYLEFHGKYYDRPCEECGSFPPDSISQLLCLLCGYSFCNYQCQEVDISHLVSEDGQSKLICATGLKHAMEKHSGLAVLMSIEDTSVLLFEQVTVEYGQLYESRLGKWNPRHDSDWSNIVLSYEKLGRLDGMTRNRKVYHEILGRINAPRRSSMTIF